MMFDLAYFSTALQLIFKATWNTVWIAILASVVAVLLGFGLEMLRRVNRTLSRWIGFLIDFIRSTPILVHIYFFYFVLPEYGITLSAEVIGIFSLGFYYSSYLAEVFKAGINAVPAGQTEAAVSLGLTQFDMLTRVVLPQMLRQVAAPVGNYFVSLLKATPYLAVIAVPEVLGIALELGSDNFRYAEPMVAAELIFLALAIIVAQLVRVMEIRMARSVRR